MVALGGKLMYSSWIALQNEKNEVLKREIGKLDAQLTKLWDAPVHTPALRWGV